MRFDSGGLGDLFSRLMVAFALMVVTVLMALAGIGFLVAALYLGLAEVTRPAAAALGTGVVIVAVALVLLVFVRRAARRRPTMAGHRVAANEPALVAELGRSVGGEVAAWARSHAAKAAVAALLAGLAVGISPRLRRNIWRLLR